jgi:hypothetical protein
MVSLYDLSKLQSILKGEEYLEIVIVGSSGIGIAWI